jgi:hypothetical protein
MAQVSQMRNLQLQERGLQNQEQMNSLKLQQFQKEQADLDALQKKIAASGGPTNLKAAAAAMLESGIPHFMDTGLKIQERLQNQANFQLLFNPPGAEPAQPNALAASVGGVAPPAAPTANSLAAAVGGNTEPSPTFQQPNVNELVRQRNAALAIGDPRSLAFAKMLDEQISEANKPMMVAPGATVFQGGKAVYTSPNKEPAIQSDIQKYEYAKKQGYKGNFVDFQRELAMAGRPPAAPRPEPAPAITSVIDPNDQTRLLSVDARAYRGGGLGSAGVIGLAGKIPQVAGEEKLNESQSNATAFGMRAKEANSIINDLSAKGTDMAAIGADVPYGVGGIINAATASPAQQQVQQAKSNFITAVLRKESGAAIGADEYERENQKYFPQVGDSEAVKSQKKTARETAVKALVIQAGPGGKQITNFSSTTTGLSPIDQEAMNWANSNPTDPRAKQIKDRLGRK